MGASKDDPMGQHEGGQGGGEKKAQEKIENWKDGKITYLGDERRDGNFGFWIGDKSEGGGGTGG